MVEGRISAGVVVGDGWNVGGGASIMGTLSGGGTAVVILIGERCLLGANSGLGSRSATTAAWWKAGLDPDGRRARAARLARWSRRAS